MTALGLIVVGVILLVLAYNAPMPAPANMLCRIFGWICTIVGAILLILGLLHLTVVPGLA